MTPTSLVRFSYLVTIKANHRGTMILQDTFPGVSDIDIASTDFADYTDCVSSCTAFMEDVKRHMSAADKTRNFVLGTEINPAVSGQSALSTDWANGEIARIWLHSGRSASETNTVAAGRGRIFKTEMVVPGAIN